MCSGAFCFIAPPLPTSALVCEKCKGVNTAKKHPHPPQISSVFHGKAVAMLPPAQLANPSGWVGGLQGKAGRVQCIASAGNRLRPLVSTTESKHKAKAPKQFPQHKPTLRCFDDCLPVTWSFRRAQMPFCLCVALHDTFCTN